MTAQGTEARRGETVGLDAKRDGPVGTADAPNPLYQEGYSMTDTTDQQAVTVAQIEAARRYIRGEDDAIAWAIQAAIDASPDRLASVSSASTIKASAEVSLMYLQTGFIECPQCGEEVPTKELDAAYELATVVQPAPTIGGTVRPEPVPATNQAGEVEELECEYDEDGSYALIWKNGYAITAFPNGKVIITKTPCEPVWMPMGCDVSHLMPAETAAGIADAFARGQAQMIDEEGPDEACRGGKEVAEFIANAIRRRTALATQPATSQEGEV